MTCIAPRSGRLEQNQGALVGGGLGSEIG